MSAQAEHTTSFPARLPLRLDWSEMDIFGHINNVMFFKYIQASRVNYWELIGLTEWYGSQSKGPMLASTSCQFRRPLYYPGNILIEARLEFIKTSSFGLNHRILDEAGNIAAEAKDVIVMYDFDKNTKIPFPAELRLKAEKVEGRAFPI